MPGGAETAAALLFLPLWLLLPHAADAGSCARSCGSLTVRYPFSFTLGCGEIHLSCDHDNGTAWVGQPDLGLVLRNVTERALVVVLKPDCSRPLNASLAALFSGSYAPTTRNALVVSSCAAAAARATNCSIPPGNYLNKPSTHCARDVAADSVRCVPPPFLNNATVARRDFLNTTEMTKLGKECTGLVSAVSYAPSPAPALLLGALDLEWWVPGPCSCSAHANCTPVTTPTAQQAFRCDCFEGFEGDGFRDGTGCRKGQYNTASVSFFLFFFGLLRVS